MSTASRIPVKLLANYGINNAGEVCGFPPEEAAKLIEGGHALAFDPKSEAVGHALGFDASGSEESTGDGTKKGKK